MNLKRKLVFIKKNSFMSKLKSGYSKRKSGSNFSGKKTIRNRGFVNKKKIRYVDYFKAFWHCKFCVLSFEYDPNRRTLLNLILYFNGIFSYILAVEGVVLNSVLENGIRLNLNNGFTTIIKNIVKNTKICSLEIKLKKGSKLLRASSSYGKILKKSLSYNVIILKSKRLKKVNSYCVATLGSILNFNYHLNRYKKAAFSRYKGFRPKVRGVAMNPVDHPHGGGEGKKSKKKVSMSP